MALQTSVISPSGKEDESTRFALSLAIFDTLIAANLAAEIIAIPDTVSDDATVSTGMRNESFRYIDQYCYSDKNESNSNLPIVLVHELHTQVHQLKQLLTNLSEQTSEMLELVWTSVSLLLSAMSALLSQESSTDLLNIAEVQAVIPDVLQALGLAGQHFARHKGSRIDTPTIPSSFKTGIPNFKRDCITIISCLSHNHETVQDQIRELGGIPLVLAQCQIDDMNPYLREHATYCVRNLLENNPENQAFVDALKPVGIQQNKDLHEMGYEAQLRDGKVGLTKITSINDI